MIYDLNDPRDFLAASEVFEKACSEKSKIEIRKPKKQRTSPQNRFYHFMLRYFALQYGCTETEASEIYMKRQACPQIFEQTKLNRFGKEIKTFRSSADLSSSEMSSAIRNFMAWASIGGIEIPDPDDTVSIKWCEREIEKQESMI